MAVLLALGDKDAPPSKPAAKARTSADSLRSMAHHGEHKDPPNSRAPTYQ
jgi:hypothetical protein